MAECNLASSKCQAVTDFTLSCSLLVAEINDAYNAFEEQRQHNATLLTQLTERDAALAAGQAEKLALEHTVQQLNEKVRLLFMLACVYVDVAGCDGQMLSSCEPWTSWHVLVCADRAMLTAILWFGRGGVGAAG